MAKKVNQRDFNWQALLYVNGSLNGSGPNAAWDCDPSLACNRRQSLMHPALFSSDTRLSSAIACYTSPQAIAGYSMGSTHSERLCASICTASTACICKSKEDKEDILDTDSLSLSARFWCQTCSTPGSGFVKGSSAAMDTWLTRYTVANYCSLLASCAGI